MARPKTLATVAVAIVLAAVLCSPTLAEDLRLMQYNLSTHHATAVSHDWSAYYNFKANSTTLAYYDSTGVYVRNSQTGATTKISSDVVSSGFDLNEKYIKWNGKVMNLSTNAMYTAASTANLGTGASDWVYTTTGYGRSTQGSLTNLITGATKNVSSFGALNGNSYAQWATQGHISLTWTVAVRDITTDNLIKQSGTVDTDGTATYLTDNWLVYQNNWDGWDHILVGMPTSGSGRWTNDMPESIYEFYGATAMIADHSDNSLSTFNMVTGTQTVVCSIPWGPTFANQFYGADLGGSNYVYWVDNVPEPSSLLALGSLLALLPLCLRRRRA